MEASFVTYYSIRSYILPRISFSYQQKSNGFVGHEGGEEEELRFLKEAGVNRVYVRKTFLAMP